MATLPEQIQKQIDAAQALMDAQRKGPDAPADGTQQASDNATKPTTEPVAPVNAQGTTAEDENSQTYAQRWRSLQGSWQAEKNRNEMLHQQIMQLQQQITAMQTAPVANMAQSRFLTDQDSADYGSDLVDVMRRAAREELKDFAGTVVALKQDIDGIRQVVPAVQRIAQDTQATAQERFFAALGSAVPDYEQVNATPEFRQWLLTADPMTGILRQTYLVDAQRAGDVERVANIFRAWKSLSGTQGQTGSRSDPRKELERQQAPSRNINVEPVATQGRIWDPSEISKLYDDKRRGLFAGKEAEFKALEQDIFKAQQEGRIQRRAA